MPQFDPTAQLPKGDKQLVPVGRYGIAIVWFERKRSKNNALSEYLNIKCEITHGPLKGKKFFSTMSLNVTVRGAAFYWAQLSAAVGVTGKFELGSFAEGTAEEGDANIRRLFLNRAFVGTVAIEQRGEYKNNSIKEIFAPQDWTEDERLENSVWETVESEDRGDFGPPDDDGIPF